MSVSEAGTNKIYIYWHVPIYIHVPYARGNI